MANSANLVLPYIAQSQTQKEVTHNDALNVLDALVQGSVISQGTNTPPGSPVDGDVYILGASPTGAWAGNANKLAFYYSGWLFRTPEEGWTFWVRDIDQFYTYTGSAWASASAAGGALGARTVRCGTQFNKTNNTLAAVTDLTKNVVSGKKYSFRALLHVTAGAVGGYLVAMGGTSTMTSIVYNVRAQRNDTAVNTVTSRQTTLGGAGVGAVGGTEVFIEIEGSFVVNAAGTFLVQFAQSVTDATQSSVLVGSTLTLEEVP